MSTEQLGKMAELNELERFLKSFTSKHQIYREQIVGSKEQDDNEFSTLLHMMEREWNKIMPGKEFFLKNTSYHLEENYFIPYTKNVSIVKNLRYMPLILHSHQFIEVNYVLKSGESYYIDKHNNLPLQDGDVILSPPNVQHVLKANNSDSIIIDMIIRVTTFDTAFLHLLNNNDYLAAMFTNALYSSSHGYVLWRTGSNEQLRGQILRMYDEWNSTDKYSDKMLEIIVTEFFITLMRCYENQVYFSAPYNTNSDERFRILLNYMYSHYQNVTLPQMSMACNYSERQIIRLLKKHTGKSFSALLLEIRMNKALSLLKNPDIPISEISKQVGYSNTGYFNRMFKQVFTFAPEEFRKKYMERIQNPDF